MALLDSEVLRIKAELGYNLLTISSEPWIGHTSIFEQIIQPFMSAGATTTSSTTVVEQVTPTPIALVLASATGFQMGQRVVVDIDSRQETATAQSLSGANLTVMLKKPHTGTYSVTVEGGESIIREILGFIRDTKLKMADAYGTGALKAVDEIQFYDSKGSTYFGILGSNLAYWREELAQALGIRSMWSAKRAGGQTLSVY